MSINEGLNFIQCANDEGNFVGTGPVPRIWPPYPSPLRHLTENWKDRFDVKSLGGDKYTLKVKSLDLYVGYDNDLVKLIPRVTHPKPGALKQPAMGSTPLSILILTNVGRPLTTRTVVR
ncbi:unnamed protein product [Rhizoctonia solani]|uniref:Uncharacterized protein n=1 Tax=Rhizoctonia solani TaxID=456999 RepID=A0A8H3CM22_9AGAM|nr:unnamed protein product [Rhizoctonia solani]